MSTENVGQPSAPQPSSAPPSEPAPNPVPAPAGPDAKEVDEGKVFAILSYIVPFIFLVPLIQRNNAFSLYHAKQVLLLMIIGFVVPSALAATCVLAFLVPFAGLALLVLAIFGIINAAQGQTKPIPLIGKFAEDWFKGITKI